MSGQRKIDPVARIEAAAEHERQIGSRFFSCIVTLEEAGGPAPEVTVVIARLFKAGWEIQSATGLSQLTVLLIFRIRPGSSRENETAT